MTNQTKEMRVCLYCKEEVKAEATKCKHCLSILMPERPEHGGTCPYCKETINPEAIKCMHCKSCLRALAGTELRDPTDLPGPAPGPAYMRPDPRRRFVTGSISAVAWSECGHASRLEDEAWNQYNWAKDTFGVDSPYTAMAWANYIRAGDARARACIV